MVGFRQPWLDFVRFGQTWSNYVGFGRIRIGRIRTNSVGFWSVVNLVYLVGFGRIRTDSDLCGLSVGHLDHDDATTSIVCNLTHLPNCHLQGYVMSKTFRTFWRARMLCRVNHNNPMDSNSHTVHQNRLRNTSCSHINTHTTHSHYPYPYGDPGNMEILTQTQSGILDQLVVCVAVLGYEN